VDLLFSEFFD
jgi:cAMP-specific phosphodiesterase 4